MDKKQIIENLLSDFFIQKNMQAYADSFLDSLQTDFKKVVDEFSKFIERRYDILGAVPEFKILEILPDFLNHFYSLKADYLKRHLDMLLKLTKDETK